jgi:hypothetical protein
MLSTTKYCIFFTYSKSLMHEESHDEEVIPHNVEIPIHDSIRELVTWECKEHGVKS